MRPLSQAQCADFSDVAFVLTDMDDTLTYHGRFAARTYAALERLQSAGIKVIPVTAAPAGWCDQMARMWPVDAVIGENGGLYMLRREGGIERRLWRAEAQLETDLERLKALHNDVLARLPQVRLAADQPFRLTSLAFERPSSPADRAALLDLLRSSGANATVNSLWVLAWIGEHDKLAMTRRLMSEVFAIDIEAQRDRVVYVGDSANDAPMFRHFPRSVGVSTVIEHLHEIAHPPAWITQGPGGEGFVEVAEAVLGALSP